MVLQPDGRISGLWAVAKSNARRFCRDESGAAFIFALVIFVLMVIVGGMAVDVARMEAQRVKIQQTLDRAVLAAADLDNLEDPKTVVEDYFEKANLLKFLDDVDVKKDLDGKLITATTDSNIETKFLHMVGVNSLNADGIGAAQEQVSNIEISLVLDVSGSMNNLNRLPDLKVAAKEFFETVLAKNPDGKALTTVSVIPYNSRVALGDDLVKHVNLDDGHTYHTCGRFRDDDVRDDFADTAIGPDTYLERNAYFMKKKNANQWLKVPDVVPAPTSSTGDIYCSVDEDRTIMLFQTDPAILTAHVNSLWPEGWTAIDQGMRWGAALIDPAFEPILEDMIGDNSLATPIPAEAIGRPAAFDDMETMKVIVLMTDGANTDQFDLKDWVKDIEDSPVYYSQIAADEFGGDGEFDGFFVHLNHSEVPNNKKVDEDYEWYRPRSPSDPADDEWMAEVNYDDLVRLTYYDLFYRFTQDDLRTFFWKYAHKNSQNYSNQDNRPKVWDWNRNKNMQIKHTNGSSADTRLKDFCEMINDDPTRRVTLYTVAFSAQSGGQTAMKNCATANGNYYDVAGLDIVEAFKSIASQINHLRLIQ